MGNVVHVFVHDAQIHQWHRDAGLGTQRQLLIRVVQGVGIDLRDGEQGAGFGHAVAAEDVDATGQCLLRQCPRQCRTADDHFPAAQIGIGRGGMAQQHMQDGRHAVRERHFLAGDQRQ
ncbi:hypothetical protein D3C73_1326600 [compost metagenome]